MTFKSLYHVNRKQQNQVFKVILSDSKALVNFLKTAPNVLPDLAPETSLPICLLLMSSNLTGFLAFPHTRQATLSSQSMCMTCYNLPPNRSNSLPSFQFIFSMQSALITLYHTATHPQRLTNSPALHSESAFPCYVPSFRNIYHILM